MLTNKNIMAVERRLSDLLQDTLDYIWARNQLFNAMAEAWPATCEEMLQSEPLQRAESLSQRIIDLVLKETFDRDRVNLMLSREIAYWREWIYDRLSKADKEDRAEKNALARMVAALDDYAQYRFNEKTTCIEECSR